MWQTVSNICDNAHTRMTAQWRVGQRWEKHDEGIQYAADSSGVCIYDCTVVTVLWARLAP